MPPRLSLLSRACCPVTAKPTPFASFLLPFFQQQQNRNASILSELSDNPGAYNKKIRRGRGPASGKGKTSGRGHGGQKQHGKVPMTAYGRFAGGQTPLEVVHGERGFENQFSVDMSPLNVDRLQSWIDQGRLDTSKPITLKELNDSRCLHGVKDGVKLLGRGAEQLRTPVNIIVSRASASAIAAVEAAGGTVTTRYYSPPAIRRIMRGLTDPINSLQTVGAAPAAAEVDEGSEAEGAAAVMSKRFTYRLPDPTSRKDIEYYRDPAHRGYLSHLVPEGQGPSLFFKTPGTGRVHHKKVTAKGGKGLAKGENRVC
ncbi:hypothetical protein B0A49_09551 [Cryomyces minteri]|uniref:Large ribosomal subunit protein uL15/eL18 domain-containing protein n=1 Tax=Cryomyces minteri TaxID=331657 RepID=A0A4U0WY06_9PEZI|nr:hypothetical protein B0A49_09551 [Cryomyces minteri]